MSGRAPVDVLFVLGPDRRPVPADPLTWSREHQKAWDGSWSVARSEEGEARIVSSFTGIAREPGEPPQVFETRVFADGVPTIDDLSCSYGTWEEAEAGHARMVARVRGFLRVERERGRGL